MRKLTMWFLNRSDTNQAVQSPKQTRSWKFWIKYTNGTIRVAKTKALISFAVNEKLICVFFSHMKNIGFLMMQPKRLIAFTLSISAEICYVSFCFGIKFIYFMKTLIKRQCSRNMNFYKRILMSFKPQFSQ